MAKEELGESQVMLPNSLAQNGRVANKSHTSNEIRSAIQSAVENLLNFVDVSAKSGTTSFRAFEMGAVAHSSCCLRQFR
jgi:hypothetical protein